MAIKSKEELEHIASILYDQIKNNKDRVVARYSNVFFDNTQILPGTENKNSGGYQTYNVEFIDQKKFASTNVTDLATNISEYNQILSNNILNFNFMPKNYELPKSENIFFESIPKNFKMYDQEFKDFINNSNFKNMSAYRSFIIEQKVIVNSNGGVAIQSIPYMDVGFSAGVYPIVLRELGAVCRTDEDVENLTKLIKYLPDPTPNGLIKNSKTFTEAFTNAQKLLDLNKIDLKKENGFKGIYDILFLDGVPVHEILGHHFEENLISLYPGESPSFSKGMEIGNNNLNLSDNPNIKISGLNAKGFTYFDAYGRMRRKVTHIEDNQIKDNLGGEYINPENQELVDTEILPGQTNQDIYGSFPQPRMSCTVLDGKTKKIDLDGKIIAISKYGKTSNKYKSYIVELQEAYFVKDKELFRIDPIIVSGGIYNALKNMVLVDGSVYNIGKCTKPNPLNPSQASLAYVSEYTRPQLWKEQQITYSKNRKNLFN